MEQNLGTLNKELEDIALQLENIFLDPNNPRFISKNWNDISDEHISDDAVQKMTRLKLEQEFSIDKLVDNIKINGIQEPIKYVEYNGQMYVVDGHHRLLAAKKLGLTEISVEKVDLPYAGYNTVDDLLWFE